MIVLPKSARRKRSRWCWKTRSTSKGNMRQLKLTKTNIYEKNTPFVADFGCNQQIWISFNDCECDDIIFVTQNNF